MRWLICILYLDSLVAQSAPFRNLDFEEVNLQGISYSHSELWPHAFGSGPLQEVVPGWRAYRGDEALIGSGYNWPPPNVLLAGFNVNVVQREVLDEIRPGWSDRFTISGEYALLVASFNFAGTPILTLQQQGDVPAWASYLEYEAVYAVDRVSMNGVTLPGEFLGPDRPGQVPGGLYRHDISRFAGTTASLEFMFGPGGFSEGVPNGIDNIRFVVPEPASMVLLGAGGTLLWCWSRQRKPGDAVK